MIQMPYIFTLIIPHKNIPDLLQRCIKSIPKRNDMQVIIVDDNSDPMQVDFTNFPGLENPHIQVLFTKENLGAGYARNKGLEMATGKWLLFADADDYFDTDALNKMLDDCKDAEADIIYLKNECIDALTQKHLNQDKLVELYEEESKRLGTESPLRYKTYAPWTKMIKRLLVDKHHITFDQEPASNDVWFSVQVGHYAQSIQVYTTPVYIRTVRQGSLQYSLVANNLLRRIAVGYKTNNFLKEQGQIAYYNETWGFFMNLRKISWWLFLKTLPTYFHNTPWIALKKNIKDCIHKNQWLVKGKRVLYKATHSQYQAMHYEFQQNLLNIVKHLYQPNANIKNLNSRKTIVYMCDGRVKHGGLADRFRGIISSYQFAKTHGLDFKIYWTSPFSLEEYLLPNTHDWRIRTEQLEYNSKVAVCLYIDSFFKRFNLDKTWEATDQEKRYNDFITRYPHALQYHIYSNAHFGDTNYHILFNELFRLHPRIEKELVTCMNEIGNRYIAMTFRFQQLLGDFKDACGGEKLSTSEQERWIKDAIALIQRLYDANKQNISKILITSDSMRFLQESRKLPFTYTPKGTVNHIDTNQQKDADKEFLDLFILSHSTHIYLCHRSPMFLSGFPRNAALIGNVPIEVLEF